MSRLFDTLLVAPEKAYVLLVWFFEWFKRSPFTFEEFLARRLSKDWKLMSLNEHEFYSRSGYKYYSAATVSEVLTFRKINHIGACVLLCRGIATIGGRDETTYDLVTSNGSLVKRFYPDYLPLNAVEFTLLYGKPLISK